MIQAYITFRILDKLYDQYDITIPHLMGDRKEAVVRKLKALEPQLVVAHDRLRSGVSTPVLEAAHAELEKEYSKALTAIVNDRETIANHMHSLCFVLLKFEPSMALVEELVTAVTAVFDDLS